MECLEDRRLLAEYLVDCLGDTETPDCLTLRRAIESSNQNPGPDSIRFDPSLAGGTIRIAKTSYPYLVADDVTITGLGRDQLTIDGDVNEDVPQGGLGDTRLFLVDTGVTLAMSALTLRNGYASEGTFGGAIFADGTLLLSDLAIRDSYAVQDGGAIYATSESPLVTLTDCVVEGNRADNGGGVYANGELVIDSSLLTNNSAGNAGGGFWVGGKLTISNSSLAENTAEMGGGGYARNAVLAVLTDSSFTQNTATVDGGAFASQWYRPVQMTRSTFVANHAGADGGAAYGLHSAEIDDSRFEQNTAGGWGGAIHSGGALIITETVFDANTAAFDGGALNTWGVNTLDDCDFIANVAGRHGGAIDHSGQLLIIGQSRFEANVANIGAGAINTGGPGVLIGSTFRLNKAGGNAGAIHAYDDNYELTIEDCLFEQNEAGTDGSGNGGGIYSRQRRVMVTGTIIRGNTADDIGGGIYVAEGLLTLSDSLVSGNTAENGRAGGIWVARPAELMAANSTVSGNAAGTAGGGLYFNGNTNTALLVNTTISNNRADRNGTTGQLGGGIYAATPGVLLRNSIVAGNFTGAATTASDVEGAVDPASAYTLVQDANSAGGLIDGVNGNRIGIDPLLGPLQDNGGRSHTHALLPGSPAIDAGDNALALAADGEPLWFDQRRFENDHSIEYDRVVNLHVDHGCLRAAATRRRTARSQVVRSGPGRPTRRDLGRFDRHQWRV